MSQSNPLLYGLIGLLAGAAAGAGAYAILAPSKTVTEQTTVTQVEQKEMTPEELAELCKNSDLFKNTQTELVSAQTKVASLQSEIEKKDADLAKMKSAAAKGDAAASKKYKDLEAEIANLKGQLAQAEKERDELVVELKKTVEELQQQIQATEVQRQRAERYKGEAHQNLWTSFSAEAKVAICDRGSRRRHDKCHEAVETALTSEMQSKFLSCVDSYQFTPMLRQLERKQEVPSNAMKLSDDDRFTDKGWYIQYCDPTLPEAGEAADAADRNATPAPTGGEVTKEVEGE